MADQKRAAVVKGGRNRRVAVPVGPPLLAGGITDMAGLSKLLFRAVEAVNSGGIELERARAIGYLAGVTAKVYEVTELARRMDEVERRCHAGGEPDVRADGDPEPAKDGGRP